MITEEMKAATIHRAKRKAEKVKKWLSYLSPTRYSLAMGIIADKRDELEGKNLGFWHAGFNHGWQECIKTLVARGLLNEKFNKMVVCNVCANVFSVNNGARVVCVCGSKDFTSLNYFNKAG